MFGPVVLCLSSIAATGVPGVDAAQESALPSGLELLYGDRIPLTEQGEPIIALGLLEGAKRVRLSATTDLLADFYEDGTLRRATLPAGAPIVVALAESTKGVRQHYVDVGGVPWSDLDALDNAMDNWRERGFANVEAMAEGIVLGILGNTLDNRAYRITLPVRSKAQGIRLKERLHTQFGVRGSVGARLTQLPSGTLKVRMGPAPLGTASSYVRFSASGDGQIQVNDVPFGQGYAWGGKEHRTYHGEIYVTLDADGRLAVVNVVNAERVLEGVVPSEIFATSPEEALKAQAVAARNHLLSQLGAGFHDAPYHLCTTQQCQVYSGTSREHPRTSAAVQATRGQVAYHSGKMVHTVYSSTCGGFSEDNDVAWNQKADPALRGRPDFDVEDHPDLAQFADGIAEHEMREWVQRYPMTYEARASKVRRDRFRWQKTLQLGDFASKIKRRWPRLGTLKKLEVVERGRGGRIVALELVGTGGRGRLVHELPIRRFFGNLKSGAFVVTSPKWSSAGALTQVTLRGAGWGHGVGMCQLGAVGRAEAGQSYGRILEHYYNGATVRTLYGAGAAQALR